MPLGLSSLLVASTLALSPFSTPLTVAPADHVGAWPTGGTPPPSTSSEPSPPAQPSPPASGEPQPDPSWNEPEATDPATAEPAPTDGTTTTGTPTDTTAPAPVVPPPVSPTPMVVTRSAPPKGLGLIIGASVTGGLAWVTVFARLAAIDRCKTAVGEAVTGMETGRSAASACFRSSGTLVSMTPLGWLFNDVTYGLAPAAGVFRGRYDGTNAAWDGKPNRPAPVLVGVGAGLLAGGVVGRIATIIAFWRQFSSLDRVFSKYPLGAHFVLAQLSAASIQAGGGLLGYGLAYKKARTTEEGRRKAAGLANVKLAPQLGLDYSGVSLVGRF